jgi:hypothetical protein
MSNERKDLQCHAPLRTAHRNYDMFYPHLPSSLAVFLAFLRRTYLSAGLLAVYLALPGSGFAILIFDMVGVTKTGSEGGVFNPRCRLLVLQSRAALQLRQMQRYRSCFGASNVNEGTLLDFLCFVDSCTNFFICAVRFPLVGVQV